MSSVAADLDRMLSLVDPQTAMLLERTVRDALALAAQRAESQKTSVDVLGYPSGYFEATSGSFANEPLEAPADPPPPQREQW